jgi:hypothetical protein
MLFCIVNLYSFHYGDVKKGEKYNQVKQIHVFGCLIKWDKCMFGTTDANWLSMFIRWRTKNHDEKPKA